jgi:hypothetical protein
MLITRRGSTVNCKQVQSEREMNVLDYQNNEEVMGGYDLKILHDGSKIKKRNVSST